jgi:hypothetical protein
LIPSLRQSFNASWTEAKFARFRSIIESHADGPLGFPLAETPCFFSQSLMTRLTAAADELIRQSLANSERDGSAVVPERFRGPNAEAHPTFLQVDFGLVCEGAEILPKLVELQAFASLYGFQRAVALAYQEAFDLPASLTPYLGELDDRSYDALVGEAIVNGHDPEQVVLMEIEPRKQKTWPDFAVTEKVWGVRPLDISEVIREGRRLFYQRDGRRVPIARIYNRVIPDELDRKGLSLSFDYRDDIDVEWAGHPSWFFKISKHSIPRLEHPSVPRTWFLDELPDVPIDRERYLLKPLFSFAGSGIVFAPTDADLAMARRNEPHDFILQQRIEFTPVIETPEGPTQAEIRMMYVWPPKGTLRPVLPLIRLGRGKMMGVDHNKGLRWVGASAGLMSE